jgi:hypothetical protein
MQKLSMVFGVCLVVAACGGNSVNRGTKGESCSSQNDCKDGLKCYNYMCSESAASQTNPDGGGSTITQGPVLSKAGESCTKRADCELGLGCFSGICSVTALPPPDAAIITIYVTVDAGTPIPTNPVLSGRGETCTMSSDCAKGLICLPLGESTVLGICDIANYGLTSGTKSCENECEKDLDCCELPLGTAGSSADTTFNSCADLLKAMTPNTGANCSDVASVSRECFLYKTYCDCATSNPWTCTTGKCSYNKACDPTVSGEKMNGCPAKTRSSLPIPTCSSKAMKCAVAVATTGCATADDCATQGTSDTGETCAAGECVCLTDIGRCYRKCNNELDCRYGYTCDTTKQVCKPAGSCTTDTYCAKYLKNAGAKCVIPAGATGGSCKLTCNIDQDCSPSGLSTAFTGSICGADKFCAPIGCTSNAECSKEIPGSGTTALGSIKMFCAATPAVAGVEWASAITD